MPRLALVLSGGGAKCAYQAGAIEALEARLENRRKACKSDCSVLSQLDVNLVVGTSGGSINALFAALGATKNPSSQKVKYRLEHLWLSLNLASLIHPSNRFLFWVSTWFGLAQSLVISIFAGFYKGPYWSWKRVFIGLSAILILEQLIAGIVQIKTSPEFYLICSTIVILTVAWTLGMWEKGVIANKGLTLIPLLSLLLMLIVGAAFQGAFYFSIAIAICGLFLAQMLLCLMIFGIMSLLEWSRLGSGTWWNLAGWTMLVLSILEFVASLTPYWGHLPSAYHWLEHYFLLQFLPFRISGFTIPMPITIGIIMVLLPSAMTKAKVNWQWDTKHALMVGGIAIAAIVVSTITVAILLEREVSPTDSAAISDAMARALPTYYSDIVENDSSGSTLERLRRYSRNIVLNNKPQRDLVITASQLRAEEEDPRKQMLPDDLYFYYQAEGPSPPSEGGQFISFQDHNEDKLLETIVGSGTIYPVFPPQKLDVAVYDQGEQRSKPTSIQIVDGGFIHNSPIDAALKWKATHIILIEASPRTEEFSTLTFQGNISNAFNYLFDQAQSRDRLTKGEAELFILRPTCAGLHLKQQCPAKSKWGMDLFDFSREPLTHAIAQGWIDVYPEEAPKNLPIYPAGWKTSWKSISEPLFVRQPGPPVFRDASKAIAEKSQ